MHVGLHPLEEDQRTLFRLRQIVTMPWSVPDEQSHIENLTHLLGALSQSDLFEGLVARAAQGMLNGHEKERRGILSVLERDTAFIEDPALWKAIKSSTFDMNQLVTVTHRTRPVRPVRLRGTENRHKEFTSPLTPRGSDRWLRDGR